MQRHVPLLIAKFSPPTATHAQVMRSALWEMVRAAPQARVILLRAPVGFGKTTTMIQIRTRLEEQRVATAWLTLDSADNDTARFLAGFGEAVAKIADEDGGQAASNRTRFDGPQGTFSIDRLAACSSPFALFLDDLHCLTEPTILRLLSQIIDQLPHFGRIVIGCRNLPDLGLGRLRAHGQLLELDAHLLRFSIAETTEFFTQCRGQALPPEDISSLQHKTEGWVAALGLASVALEQRESSGWVAALGLAPEGQEQRESSEAFIARFSGSNQVVTDYLANAVFANQSVPVQDFLLRTSVLRQLTPPLCDALTGRSDSDRMLRSLEAANLFLAPIAAEDQVTYRYHSLFASFLQGMLVRDRLDEVAQLHQVASTWYASQGRPVPAIDHALQAKDYRSALRLLSENAEELLGQGRLRLLQRWFSAVPEALLKRDPLLQVLYAWAVCLTRGAAEAAALLERLGCEDRGDLAVRAHLLALRQVLLSNIDNLDEAIAVGRQALTLVPSGKAFADSLIINMLACNLSAIGEHDEARQLWDAARQQRPENTSSFDTMLSESMEGMFDLQAGRMRQAVARFSIAVGATRAAAQTYTSGNALPGVLYACALYEANDCVQAENLLQIYLPAAEESGMPDHVIVAYVTLSRIAFARGDAEGALQCLLSLEQLGRRNQLPRLVATAKLERSRVLLLLGRFPAAREEIDHANDRKLWPRLRRLRCLGNDTEYPELCQFRWEVLAGNAAKALAGLDEEIALAEAESRHRRALKLRVLRSLALDRSGDRPAALAALGGALRSASAEGFQRIILDEGKEVGALVHHFERTYQEQNFQRRDPIFTESLQRLLQGFSAAPAETRDVVVADGKPPETLTRKEIRILRLLAEGHSNSTMAEKLFVSDSTVRTHLRNINAKLGAKNRTEAVAIGRKLGLFV